MTTPRQSLEAAIERMTSVSADRLRCLSEGRLNDLAYSLLDMPDDQRVGVVEKAIRQYEVHA